MFLVLSPLLTFRKKAIDHVLKSDDMVFDDLIASSLLLWYTWLSMMEKSNLAILFSTKVPYIFV